MKKLQLSSASILRFLTNSSPLLIIFVFLLSFSTMGIFQVNYYSEIFNTRLPNIGPLLAVFIALVTQFARLAFGLAGARDISSGKVVTGALGLLASLGVTMFEHWEVARMAEHWATPALLHLLQFVVWVAFLAEIRLLMTGANEEAAEAEEEYQQSRHQRSGNGIPAYS